MKLSRLAALPKAAIVTLALGIGSATAVMTVAEALLLRPLPVARERDLVVLHGTTPDGRLPNVPVALNELLEFQRQSAALNQTAYHTFRGAATETFRTGDRALPVSIALVSGNWFDVLGARPALGRTFLPEDDARGAVPVLVLSHRAWRQHFGGDSSVIGKQMAVATTGRALEIVGVMPPGLEYPRGTEGWTPLTAYSIANGSFDLASNELNIVGRLATGATAGQARADLTAFFSRLPSPAWRSESQGVVQSFRDSVLGDVRPAMRVILFAAVMLLLVACVNVTNLLLIRTIDGARGVLIRLALGASRWRIVRHQMSAMGALAIIAGTTGILVGAALVEAFVALAPRGLPRLDTIQINVYAVLGAIGITVVTLAVSGLFPTLVASRVNIADALRSGTKQTMGMRFRLVGETLAGVQVAFAVVALSAGVLVTRSFLNLQHTELQFDAEQLVAAELAIPVDRVSDNARIQDFYRRLSDRLTSSRVIRSVTPVLSVPFVGSGGGIDGRPAIPGQGAEERQQNPVVNMDIVTPTYFATIGTRVLQGRPFTDADREGSPGVVMVSTATAQSLWPGQDAIGKRIEMGRGRELTVIGVVSETRYRDLRSARASLYFPLAQSFFPVAPTKLLVRTEGTASVSSLIRQAVLETDPAVTVAGVATLAEYMTGPTAQPRLNSIILAAFAMTAVILAAIGLVSVMSTMVRRRRHEIGIRMALGATRATVGRMVVARGLAISAVGLVVGIAASRATGAMMSGLLYGIESTDVPTTAIVAISVVVVAIVASLLPAHAGSRIEPVIALRSDA